ncbi:zf-TFIIB domain-containing protein [Pseudoxanthomonas sp. CAU 1598]|uniref:Zf-TFIIB domain-containing protein n=2 Tax=Pseudomarimonas arenosa TaxID=2774145 RepID=A0AAW3ZQS6_9GAMM|nr:zf-TFIIB domain-containing protein [Pseudomarimonas arenosa]
MQCPKCRATMQSLVVDEVEIERCEGCGGLWFDMLEEELLKQHAEQIDIGDPQVGRQQNSNDRIDCPRCKSGQPLIRMVDAAQPHIWFESCTVCYGRFYDAGEFKDFAEFNLSDWLKRLRAQPRPD